MRFKRYWSAAFFSLLANVLSAQTEEKPSLHSGVLAENYELDGRFDELIWTQADSISGLTMIEPAEGGMPSNRTVVKVLANAGALVIGVRCFDSAPEEIVAFSKARDAELESEDHLVIILDTFLDGRSGYIFAVNPVGARYDALVADQGEGQNSNWDAIWEAKTSIDAGGWSAEIKIPIKSLRFKKGLQTWGFNVQRRIQRLQETNRWAGAKRDYEISQTSRAGLLTGLPDFVYGLGLNLRPSTIGGVGVAAPGAKTDFTKDASLDIFQKLGPNLQAAVTINTDFAETDVDARQTKLTRFPLFFPEKRAFFLEGADIFEFGLGVRQYVIPYFSRRFGLLQGRQAPIDVGGKMDGRVGNTNLGALAVRSGEVENFAPDATMGVVRVKQNVFAESSIGMIATFGDPLDRDNSWLAGVDLTYQTSKFRGDKNFLVGIWGLRNDRADLRGDKSAAGIKIDYPNDLWDVAFVYNRIGDGFQPSLGFVPRAGIQNWRLSMVYSPRPQWRLVRQMFHEFVPMLVTDLRNNWESYRVFTAPINWQLESGDRFEFNVVPEGERLVAPFEIEENVVIPAGAYHWTRYRVEGESAAKRNLSGQLTWWFGGFYSGHLDQIELELALKPSAVFTMELNGELNYGRLQEGKFTQRLFGGRLSVNLSPDLQLSSFLQYDNESNSIGLNSRLRWTFTPLGDLFVVYNHNLAKSFADRWIRESNQLLMKLQYNVRI